MLRKIDLAIPAQPGAYALWLYLPQAQNLTIGKLGCFDFPAGDYLYLGSARGPGGLRARLGRHLRGEGKLRWHVDYLRAAAQVRGFAYALEANCDPEQLPGECAWSQKLAPFPGAGAPIPGFGASDCPSGCAAHLVHLPALDPGPISALFNCQIRVLKGE